MRRIVWGGSEVLIVSYQDKTGTVNAGAHPGSYNGQDAYNDMLVIDGIFNSKNRRVQAVAESVNCERERLQECDRPCNQRERESMADSIVRRLTPMECERLQGMPDDWSKYGINEKGEVYELPDSARYRLQGNGIATPFWKYLLKRISAQYERDPTMGSLFDGQASFPMLWEGINGSGTCLWSSEIDKHAVAVAKYHFPESE